MLESNGNPIPAYAFGFNEHTQALAACYPLLGIIDEYSQANSIAGLPRLGLDQLDPKYPIINCVYNSRAFQAQSRLETLGFDEVYFIGDYISRNPELFRNTMLAEAYLAMQEDFLLLKDWQQLFVDERSQEEYASILDFRRTLNVYHLSDFKVKIDQQYFENFLLAKGYKRLIDGGAFDGSDSLKFAENFPNYEAIVVLEPSEKNREKITQKMVGIRDVKVMAACLGDTTGTVFFAGEGTAAKIVESGGVPTAMTTIDSLLTDSPTLVKLDIEGAEMKALAGAARALHNPNVGFAISSYHLPHDLMHILDWLRMSNVKRQFFFRHYSGGIAESVIFAL